MRVCGRCRYGVDEIDGTTPYTVCALLPPKDIMLEGKVAWIRPPMAMRGWCGQFRFGWLRALKHLFDGSRA